ncbi:FAD-dependent thymidylate synthase [Candidatus Babeliales bacterium]|nr:FAD-dependent thymidylate synthase [Candidatus Babeliales bacterium]
MKQIVKNKSDYYMDTSENFSTLIEYPYGEKDPCALVELIARTKLHGEKYICDQMPVLAARVSHASSGKTGKDFEGDKKLMNYLAKNKHFSPFEHQSATFKIVTPIFVTRQWMRHRTQSYNEVSMRYSQDPVGKFYYPHTWRQQSSRNKQLGVGGVEDQKGCFEILKKAYKNALNSYIGLLKKGVCREQARMVIPVGNYTQFYATANLRNWMAFYKLRIAEDAQWEIRQYAKSIDNIFNKIWPDAWNSLKEA